MAPRLRAVKEHSTEQALVSPSGRLAAPATAASMRGLSRAFGGRTVLDGLDLDIARGEFIALIGRSGSGKSTLLRALAGLDRQVTGQLSAAGPAWVAFQEPRLVPWKRGWPTSRSAYGSPIRRPAPGPRWTRSRPSVLRHGLPRCPAARRSVCRWPGH